MKNVVFWDVLEEHITSIFRVKIISKLGTLAVTRSYSMLQRINHCIIKSAIEWDVLHDGQERELPVMGSSSCLFITMDTQ
jgi:hypothetical protein